MATDVVVLGVGMMTPVGLTSAETAASVDAGTMRFTETDIRDKRFEPVTLAEVPEEGLPGLAEELDGLDLTSREARMVRLGSMPLQECLGLLPAEKEPPALILALPEMETTRPLDGHQFLQWFQLQTGGAFDVKSSSATARGRAGGLAAIGKAVELVATGAMSFAVAGGVDTLRDLYVLGTLDMEGRLKSAANLDGFIPGEGAAFLLLANRDTAAAAGCAPVAAISRVAQGFEPGHFYSEEPYRGDGLAATIQQLVGFGAASTPYQEVYSSMNGESHWAKEWGVAYLRSSSAIVEAYDMHHPADCVGDTGAACGPLMCGLVAIALGQGHLQGPVLAYASSDRGARAALAITAA
jgi:3-oxoacyl-[acyl-carrier-protein] synthase-1